MRLVASVIYLMLVPVTVFAQPNVEKEVLAADAALDAAIEKGDADAYDKLSAEDFIWVRPTGSTWPRVSAWR